MARWSNDVNVAGEPYIFDKETKRQYCMDELHLICCEMNQYEKRIEQLENKIWELIYTRKW